MRGLLNYCAAKFEDVDGSPLVKHNPVLILTQTRQWYRVNRRQTIIKSKDLPKWFKAVTELKSTVVRDYLLTLLLSGLRRNEALPLEKKMIDLEERTITLLDTKNNKPFLIPIPNYLHKVLKVRINAKDGSKYIFPSRMKGRHITEPQSGINAVIKTSKVEFCSHDLRRLFVTTAEALDLSPFVIKRLVNHAIGSDTTSGYIVSDLDRLRGPIQKIEDRILSLAKAKEPGKVVKIKRA
jgi:integrase